MVALKLVDLNETQPPGRAKPLARRVDDVACHGQHDAADIAGDQGKGSTDASPRNPSSKAADRWRMLGTEMLREALAVLSLRDIAAAIGASHQHVAEMLAGTRPWKAESFVRIAISYPEVAERIIQIYARRMLPVASFRRLAHWFSECVREMEAAPC